MSCHPHVCHVDDVEAQQIAMGELRWSRRRLAAAAGARRIGVSRFDVEPGGRTTPPHVHADEEEVFWVLSGDGTLWQDGAEHAIAAGDCIVHTRDSGAHTLFAGPDGLSVLAFAEGSRTDITWVPRSKSFWLGPRWSPADGPNPFRADSELPPMQRAAPTPRPANVVASGDCPWEHDETAGFEGRERRVSREAGSRDVGLRHVELSPGNASCPAHFHMGEEECFYVLGGAGEIVLGEDSVALRAGSFAVRPPSTGVAHQLRAGEEGLQYLAFGQNLDLDVVFYPDSNKVNISGLIFRVEPVPYHDPA